MKINTIFSSFLATDFLTTIDNEELKRYAFELKEKDKGVIKSNFLGWQSDILQIPNDQISALVNCILERADKLKLELKFKKESYVFLNNLWININPTSSFNRPHIHPDAIFSGVYYVDCNDDSGKIVFKHPSDAQQFSLREELLEEFTDFNAASWSVLPEVGKLVIFPSWLEHYVEPNVSDKERISIAFNIDIGRD